MDSSPESLYDYVTNGQSQAGALGEFVEFVEAFENGALFFGRNTSAGVFHIEFCLGTFRRGFISDADIAFLGEFGGVVDKVGNELGQPVPVGIQRDGGGGGA